jgi:plasmid stabilization system protein ParE
MARVLKREAARRDLVQQWVWYAENAGIELADRFLRAADTVKILLFCFLCRTELTWSA